MLRHLTDAVNCLASEIKNLGVQLDTKIELTKIQMKLNELGNDVKAIKAKLEKVFTEQQGKFDALQEAYDKLKGQLENVDVPDEVSTTLEEIDTKLQAIDDSIPDITPPPAG